jgi:trehalose 6-phosphate phosphatase
MKYLFTSPGSKVLESLTFTKTLYAFDFDGTLAPIASTPDEVKLSATTNNLLKSLAEIVPLAIISGRSISDLKKCMDFTPEYLIGNHGLEGLSLRADSASLAESICNSWKKQLEKNWEFEPGVFIEDKTYSIAIHYRRSRNKKNVKHLLYEKLEILDPAPRLVLGKCVMNLIPPGAPHKGVALLELMKWLDLKCAFYVGDDDTDEDVFSLPDDSIITTRVGQKRTSQAQYFIKRQNEVNQLLKYILKQAQKCQTNR